MLIYHTFCTHIHILLIPGVVTDSVNHAIQSTLGMEWKTSEVDIYGSDRIGGRRNENHNDRRLVNGQIIVMQLLIRTTHVYTFLYK